MIVQGNPSATASDAARFVMTMDQHTAFADALALHFGNDAFAAITDSSVRYVIAHHDAGWRAVDHDVHINPATGLPYHLAETPFDYTSRTMRGSPDFNAKHSALAGLLSSMHTAGLLNGRYGLAPPGILARFEGKKRTQAEQVLADELARQDQLKTEVDVDDTVVWTAYKQLQFFDMLSLYFHSKPEGARGTESFPDVPTLTGDDVIIHIAEHPGAVYTLDPYPFAEAAFTLSFEGRWMSPVQEHETGRGAWETTPIDSQMVKLQRG